MWELGSILNFFCESRKQRYDNDSSDACVGKVVATYFLCTAVITTFHSYVGDQISCVYPPALGETYLKYLEMNCLLHNTYYWPMDLPLNQTDESKYEIRYNTHYPFMYMLLMLSSLLFIIPDILWRVLSKRSGYGLSKIIQAISYMRNENSKAENQQLMFITYNLKLLALNYAKERMYGNKPWTFDIFTSNRENYLMVSYLIYKALQILFTLAVICLWQVSLQKQFIGLGIDFLKRIFDRPYQSSKLFPLYGLCDVSIRNLTTTNYSFECIMTRNVYYDLLVTVVWFIVLITLGVTIYSFCKILFTFYSRNSRYKLFKAWLDQFLIEVDCNIDRKFECPDCYIEFKLEPCVRCREYMMTRTFSRKEVELFYEKNLFIDIVLTLWFISINSNFGNVFPGKILLNLWSMRYRKIEKPKTLASTIKPFEWNLKDSEDDIDQKDDEFIDDKSDSMDKTE